MKITKLCPVCNTKAEEKSHSILSAIKLRLITLSCGHTYSEKILPPKNWESFVTQIGPAKKLRPYQGEGYEFARNSGFRCLIADEPGVGKTLQPAACVFLHPELRPALIIVKSALKLQFQKVYTTWCGFDLIPEIIESSEQEISGVSEIVITTYDILWRMQKKLETARSEAISEVRRRLNLSEFAKLPDDELNKLPDVTNPFKKYNFQSLTLDECQQIKNWESKRTQMVVNIAEHIPHIMATSGSPIEKHAGEYFPILHILRPEIFKDRKQFLEWDCDYYFDGKKYRLGGIRDLEAWKKKTGDFIIRRKLKDVLPDLPSLDRKFVECDFASEKIKKAYKKEQEEFDELFKDSDDSNESFMNLLAKMSKLRHLAGLNKVPFCADFVQEFLEGTDRKIIIGIHHQDVGHLLEASLNQIQKELENGDEIKPVLTYTSDLDSKKRQDVIDTFISDDKVRVLIASTLAAGEGIDGLQDVCCDLILLERQWNPGKEEQFEHRLLRSGQLNPVSANYPIAVGTIDEFFTELVEAKRAAVSSTLDGQEVTWNENSLLKELMETLAKKGSKAWKL